jgi:hypothetical protein
VEQRGSAARRRPGAAIMRGMAQADIDPPAVDAPEVRLHLGHAGRVVPGRARAGAAATEGGCAARRGFRQTADARGVSGAIS